MCECLAGYTCCSTRYSVPYQLIDIIACFRKKYSAGSMVLAMSSLANKHDDRAATRHSGHSSPLNTHSIGLCQLSTPCQKACLLENSDDLIARLRKHSQVMSERTCFFGWAADSGGGLEICKNKTGYFPFCSVFRTDFLLESKKYPKSKL